jgi:hypothetical protein
MTRTEGNEPRSVGRPADYEHKGLNMPENTVTTPGPVKVAVIVHQGVMRVHADGCADVAKEAKRFHDTPWVFDAVDRHDVNLLCWGDVAGDTTQSGTPEWEKLCDEYGSAETKFLPCISALPAVAAQ